MKTREEIEKVIDKVMDMITEGRSKYSGMSYEEGVEEALRWVTGDSDDESWPFGEEE